MINALRAACALKSAHQRLSENIIDLKGCGSVLSRSAACDFMAEKGGKS
jgi:hypothetical protein